MDTSNIYWVKVTRYTLEVSDDRKFFRKGRGVSSTRGMPRDHRMCRISLRLQSKMKIHHPVDITQHLIPFNSLISYRQHNQASYFIRI